MLVFILRIRHEDTILGVYASHRAAWDASLEHARNNHGNYDGEYVIDGRTVEGEPEPACTPCGGCDALCYPHELLNGLCCDCYRNQQQKAGGE